MGALVCLNAKRKTDAEGECGNAILPRTGSFSVTPCPAKSLPDQRKQIVFTQTRAHFGAIEKIGGEIALVFVQLEDALLDAVLDHKPVDRDWPVLADAVGAIGRLILDRWIPPGVEMDHVIRRRQVETCAAGLEADEEKIAIARLKGRHAVRPRLRGH